MSKKWAVIAACAVVAGVALWLTFFRASDEDRIRAVLDAFANAVAVKDGDTVLSRAARLNDRLNELVSDDVHVDVSELSMSVRGRSKLVEDATRAGLMFQSASCAFTGVTIKIDPAATLATVDATALVTGERGGERKVDKRSVHLLLRKDDRWKIDTLEVMAPQLQ